MHIDMPFRIGTLQLEVIFERCPWHERKRCTQQLYPNPSVAERAHFNLSVAWELRGIHDLLVLGRFRYTSVPLNVLAAGSMANLARDAGNERVFYIQVVG